MKLLGVILTILGLGIAAFGGLGILIYGLYDLISNFSTLTGWEVFWKVIFILIRDLVALLIGVVVYIVGMFIASKGD